MPQPLYPFGLTKEYLDVLAVLGTWVAAMGSIGAAVVALYLANRSGAQRLKPNVTVVLRLTPAIPTLQIEARTDTFLRFDVVNSGDRPVRITQLGWQSGLWKKIQCVQKVSGVSGNSSLPVDLEHGQSASWLIPLEDSDDSWESYFGRTFLRNAGPFRFLTLRALFQTSLGKTFTVRPASNLVKRIKLAYVA
jgi:hypothetical protein